jgi:hypothetical protein
MRFIVIHFLYFVLIRKVLHLLHSGLYPRPKEALPAVQISLQMMLLKLPVIPQTKLSQLPLFSLPTQLPLQTWHQDSRFGMQLYQLSMQQAAPLRLQLFMLLLC